MIVYLLKSAACLSLLLLFYHLVLEKERMHNFNRFYLLGAILFSFLIPFYIIYTEPLPVEIIPTTYYTEALIDSEIGLQNIEPTYTIDYTKILMYLYGLISLILLIRFVRNVYKIAQKIALNQKVKYESATLVLVDDKIVPHTFWSYIFINKSDYFDEKIEDELFTHELTHVTQKHTFDVVLLEILLAVFWINPMFFFIKKAIQLNHEYLADENVIHQHKNTFQYQHLLLNKAAWKNEYYLASNLNYLVTKKRLKMMTIQSSPLKILLKKLAVIPLLAGFTFLFAERVEAQEVIQEEKEVPVETIVEQVSKNELDYSKNKLYQEYVYSLGKVIYKNKNGKEVLKKYSELTEEEKKKLVPPPPLKSKKKVPSQKLIEQLKDGKKYALWIDGKEVKNQVLENYKNSDFYGYFVSFVHKNARSKKFPQEYQAHLDTKQYFELQNKQRVERFLKYLKEKHNIEEIEEEAKPDIIKIKEKKKSNLPSSNGSKQSILNTNFSKKLAEINKLKMSYTDKINSGFKNINGTIFYFVSINGVNKYYNKKGKLADKNGNQISNKKAKASEIMPDRYVRKVYYKDAVFCEFIDDKPKSEKEQIKGLEELEQLVKKENKAYSIEKYLKINELYEFSRRKKPHYVNSDRKRQEKLEEQFSLLGTLYFKLSKEDKKKTKRPIHPHDPYFKLRKNNKIFYKLRSELTEEDKLLIPPPPPVPNASKEEILKAKKAYKEWEKKTGNKVLPPPPPISPLDQIIKMAKNEAQFYFEGKEITSDEAISLIKKNKKLHIHSESTDFNAYKVWISRKEIKKNNALSNFDIKMSKNSTNITLTCENGCKWKKLEFKLNEGKNQIIDEFGMTNEKRKKSSFVFDISYKSNRVNLKGYKGTAWKGLGFTIKNYSKIDQFGVRTH